MNSLLICLLAASFASLANLLFRRSSEKSSIKSRYNYYLLFFYLTSFFVSLLLTPSRLFTEFNPVMFTVGCLVGALSMIMMWLTSKALLTGPTGLSFAFQNASGIFPGIVLFSLFGPLFGFEISLFQLMGMGLVVVGLFLGTAKSPREQTLSIKWLMYALGCFLVQVCALSLIHWRCLLFTSDLPQHCLIPWNLAEQSDAWFLPGQFGTSFLLQLIIVWWREKEWFVPSEVTYGTLGGVANILASFCLLVSTKMASPLEKSLIFPCFAASTMILCNAWAYRFYKERFHLAANCYCATGIFLGTFV